MGLGPSEHISLTAPESRKGAGENWLANCIFIDSRGLSHDLDEGYKRPGLGKAAEALVLGAHCSVEVVRAKYFGGPYLKPAA